MLETGRQAVGPQMFLLYSARCGRGFLTIAFLDKLDFVEQKARSCAPHTTHPAFETQLECFCFDKASNQDSSR